MLGQISKIYYNYDANNRLSSISGSNATNFNYDTFGNISVGMGNSYSYDGVPNLRCVNCNKANNKIEYSYDATNKRSKVNKDGVQTYEMYSSNGNLLIEYTPTKSNKQVGVTTVGDVRQAGGNVVPSPTAGNPNHCTLCGITPQQAERLMTPTIRNPHQ